MDTASALLATVISSDRAALHNKGSAALYRHTAAAGIAANTSSELTGIAAAAVFQGKGICRDQQDMSFIPCPKGIIPSMYPKGGQL